MSGTLAPSDALGVLARIQRELRVAHTTLLEHDWSEPNPADEAFRTMSAAAELGERVLGELADLLEQPIGAAGPAQAGWTLANVAVSGLMSTHARHDWADAPSMAGSVLTVAEALTELLEAHHG